MISTKGPGLGPGVRGRWKKGERIDRPPCHTIKIKVID